MDAKCSCPGCDTFSCYSKHGQRGLEPYNNSTILSKIHPPIDYVKALPILDNKKDIIASKETKDEIEIDRESEKSIESVSIMTTEDVISEKLKDFQLIPTSRNTLCPSVAKLSAQVMNFPFKDYQCALSQQKAESQTNIAKLTSFDIFEKIKEVYKACSCKVCECIVGKPQTNQVCNCKPCDCEDCKSMGRVTISKAFRSIGVAQAEPDYERFGSSLLGGLVRPNRELQQSCKCKPCECNQCYKNFSTPCKCKRCSCVECESRYQRNYQKLVVAAVESDNQTRQDCMCTPCQCAECSHRYGASSRIRHEVSTEILRHLGCHCNTCLNNTCAPEGSDACTCEKAGNKVVRKPVQRDTDFDIHRSLVTHQKFGINTKTKHDLIAMFAAVSKSYTGYHQSNHCCSCGRCGCMYCSSKFVQNSADAVKSSTVTLNSINYDVTSTLRSDSSALDSKITSRKSCLKASIQSVMNNNNIPMYTDHHKPSTEIKAANIYSLSTEKSKTRNTDNALDTFTGDIDLSEQDIIYPIKKGKKITPYLFGRKVNKPYIRFYEKKEEDYETPAKRARISEDKNLNVTVTKGDNHRGYLLIKHPDIDSTKDNDKVVKHVKSDETSKTAEIQFSTVFGQNPSNSLFRFDCLTNTIANDDSCINILHNTVSNKKYTSNVSFKTNASEKDKDTNSKKYCENFLLKVDNLLCNRQTNKLSRKNNSSVYNISQTVSSCDKDSRTDTVCHENKSVCYNMESNRGSLFEDIEKSKQSEVQEELKNLLCNDENYRRVENTLKEARDFTQQLMELLNKYEKANKEFESVYDKLEHSNIKNDTFSEHKFQELEPIRKTENQDSKDDYDTIPNKETNLYIETDDCLIERENVPNPKESSQNQANNINKESKLKLNLSRDCLVNGINKIYPIKDKANLNDTSCSSKTSNDVIIQFREDSLNAVSVDSTIMTDDFIKCESGLNPITETNVSSINQIKYLARNKRRRCKRYSKIYKQAVAASKRSKLFVPQTPRCSTEISQDFWEHIHKTEEKSYSKNDSPITSDASETKVHALENDKKEIKKELNPVVSTNVNYLETRTFIHANIGPKNETIKFSEAIENQEIKQFACKSNESQFSLSVYRKRSLEKGIKEAVNAIKQASVTWEHKTHGKEALSKLHSEVKKLLELPLLQKCDIDSNDSSQHHATDIKRRVLLNGRFAQKILDQTRCETVLDHIPQSGKILLTVRTLTKSRCQSGHNPSSTVVYKPSSRNPMKAE